MNKDINIHISTIIWANIRKVQRIRCISDEELACILEVSTRTLYNYEKEPERLTMKKIERFMNYTDKEFNYFIQ